MPIMVERANSTNPRGLGKAGEQIVNARRPRVGALCARSLHGKANRDSSVAAEAQPRASQDITGQHGKCWVSQGSRQEGGCTAATATRAEDMAPPGTVPLAFSNL